MTDEEYKKHYENVYGQVIKLLGSVENAEDVAQETMITVFRKLHQWRGDCSLSSWIYRIGHNCALMSLRKMKSRDRLIDFRVMSELLDKDLRNYTCEMEDPILDKKMLDRNFDPEEKAIIKMSILGYSNKEMATIQGKTIAAIKSKRHRIKLKLRKPRKHSKENPVKMPIAEITKEEYKPSIPAKVYKFTPSIKPKNLPKPRKHTVGTGDIRPRTWDEYFNRKKVINE